MRKREKGDWARWEEALVGSGVRWESPWGVVEGSDDGAGVVVPTIRVDFGVRANWGVDAIGAHLRRIPIRRQQSHKWRNTH